MNIVKHIKRPYYTVLFLNWFAAALPLALIVLLLQSRGINLFQLGILMGAYSLTIVLLEVPTGGLADAIGRKRVTLLAYTVAALTNLLVLFAFSFPLFLLAFVLNGVSRALSSGALDAWFVDALQTADPDGDIQPALAQAETVSLLALGGGTLVGGLIPQWFARLPSGPTDIFTPLTMTLVIALFVRILLLLALTIGIHEERPSSNKSGWRDGIQQVPTIMREAIQLTGSNRTIFLLLGTTFAGGFAIISLETFWQPFFAQRLGGGAEYSFTFGIIMMGYFLIGIVGNFLATYLSKLLRKQYVIVAALFQMAQGVLLLLLTGTTAVIPAIALFWLTFMSLNGVHSPQATLLNEEIPTERRSAMLSVQSLAGYAGSILGSVGLGYIAETFSIQTAWTITGAVLLVSLILYLRIYTHKQHEQKTAILPTS